MIEPYVSPYPWSAERPDTLIVICSDGRLRLQVIDFVREKVSIEQRPDLFAVPGGPAAIDPWASSFDHARVFEEALRLLLAVHGLSSVWLIGHEGCAYYRERHAGLSDAELEATALKDLRAARARIAEIDPKLAVHCIWVRVQGARVTFERVSET